jgi:type II restriction/modification system DNA methylase subunit YeeA
MSRPSPRLHSNPLSQTYEDEAAFLRDVPRLIIEHNIYGVDIDPRAAQIASLALWLRAQRAWHDASRPKTAR